MEKQTITVEVFINVPLAAVWEYWTAPQHIINWNQPSGDWRTARVENDPRTNGRFLFVMEKKDGSAGFDFQGAYDKVVPHELMSYTLDDGRTTTNVFTATGNGTTITETFEPEGQTPLEEQRRFCAGVLQNFKAYAEAQADANPKNVAS